MRRVAVWLAVAAACVCSASAYQPPPLLLQSTNVAAWCTSVHLLAATNYDGGQLELTLLIEKPPSPCIFWTVDADLRDGTNKVAAFALGTELLDAQYLRHCGVDPAGVKAVQRFRLSCSTNCLPESRLCISQHNLWASPFEDYPLVEQTLVRVSDLVNGATNQLFRPGKPLFRHKN